MGTGNNDVGKAPSKKTLLDQSSLNTPAVLQIKRCQGAMSQQGFGAHGNECYPQKLVQLVGYRGPQSQESWDRLRLKRSVIQSAD